MRVLLDTNIIIRAAQPNQPTWSEINQALTALVTLGCTLCVVPQNIYEFWVVATRPLAQNGFGMTPADGRDLNEQIEEELRRQKEQRQFERELAELLQNPGEFDINKYAEFLRRHAIDPSRLIPGYPEGPDPKRVSSGIARGSSDPNDRQSAMPSSRWTGESSGNALGTMS
jgi:hypothetical protein